MEYLLLMREKNLQQTLILIHLLPQFINCISYNNQQESKQLFFYGKDKRLLLFFQRKQLLFNLKSMGIGLKLLFIKYSFNASSKLIGKLVLQQQIFQLSKLQKIKMKTFRKKYIYNPENPIYESDTARTYNCMNTETKEKRLIIIEHLKDTPFVQPAQGILQPIQIPTSIQPFSVYPIVRCVSQINKVSEPEAMYVLKCILECKLKKPLYCTISTQGICCTDVEGILPSRTPEIFQLAIDMLDIPSSLQEVEKSVVSKEGYSICKALKKGQNPLPSIQNYGWKDIKKQRQQVTDDEFIVFKGRRNEEGPFGGQYGLAWSNEHGLCRMKYISLTKDGYQDEWEKQYNKIRNYIQNCDKNVNNPLFLKIYKFSKTLEGIKIFSQIANQGSLSDYISKKYELHQVLTQKNCSLILDAFIGNMTYLNKDEKEKIKIPGLGTLHIKSLFVHNNRICIGDPLFITDKTEKKLRQLKSSMDYFAPQFKQNIILLEGLKKLDREKMDIWSFGFILHKIFTREVPVFDSSKKPTISKDKFSPGMYELINKCLDLVPANRPTWASIRMKQITSKIVEIQEAKQEPMIPVRQEIRLGSRSERRQQQIKSPGKKSRVVEQLGEESLIQNKAKQGDEENEKLKQQQEEVDVPYISPLPTQISSRLKKIKLIVKIILVLALYIFLFFRMFLGNTINLTSVRSFYTTATLKLVDYSSNLLSTVTVITNDPLFFLKNDISFTEIQEKYQCINDKFDPIYNPTFSLLTYVHSADFMFMIIAGWIIAIIICTIKGISIWKGGISNRPMKKQGRFWAIYTFHELTLASLLFAHFYIFQFFYFVGSVPCLSMNSFSGLQPLFDSSLFLFLQNKNGYFQQVFSTLGILSLLLVASTCFYAWGPKLDQKYFISVPSILLRIIPFILLLLICRIGVFMLFSPTAINDQAKLLPAIISNSFQGFIGIIPEMFILITVVLQVLIELLMLWCEKKASESDQLGKLFNMKDKKISVNNDESKIVDMSLVNNSKHKLNDVQQL